jgi:hypothetical protein
MPMMTDVAQEKQRVSDQLARLDAERARLKDRFDELEVAERVLSRFGKPGERPRQGRAAVARSKQTGGGERKGARPRETEPMPLGEATLKAVQAHSAGIAADAIRSYLARRFGLQVRPNHLGMALQRHRRAGRIEIRDSRWHAR